MVDLLKQRHEQGRRFEPTEFIEYGARVAVRLTVSDASWHDETAEIFKVFTFEDEDGKAILIQDCTGRDDALEYVVPA
ncbi:MAG TPA: hypothetical protein VGU02_08120 [Gaiellaceae bacterium]|nr:hypothetical protein [Gaiellaceae bacterium]